MKKFSRAAGRAVAKIAKVLCHGGADTLRHLVEGGLDLRAAVPLAVERFMASAEPGSCDAMHGSRMATYTWAETSVSDTTCTGRTKWAVALDGTVTVERVELSWPADVLRVRVIARWTLAPHGAVTGPDDPALLEGAPRAIVFALGGRSIFRRTAEVDAREEAAYRAAEAAAKAERDAAGGW